MANSPERFELRCLDVKLATIRHGIASVDGQVHDDLLDLVGIGAHGASLRIEREHHINILSNQALEHLLEVADYIVHRDVPRLADLAAAEGQKLACQATPVHGRFHDFRHGLVQRVIGGKFVQRHLRIAGNYGDQVVEIVRHTAGETADSVELLSLLELRFKLQALGDVLRELLIVGGVKLTFQLGDAIAKVPLLTFGHSTPLICWIILRT